MKTKRPVPHQNVRHLITRQLIFLISAMALTGQATGSTETPRAGPPSQTPTRPVNGALVAAKPAHTVPRKDGVAGIAAFAEDNKGLTPDQTRIGYELCGGLGLGRPDCPQKIDRARVLKLIKQTRDSLDFLDGMNMNTPLTLAANRGDVELVTAIMAKGVSLHMPRAADRQIDVALERAVFGLTVSVSDVHPPFWGPPEGYVATIRLLLNAGAIPQVKDWQGAGPVDEALWMRTPDAASIKIRNEIVQLLLEHGAVPNTALPPSQLACLKDEVILNTLLAHGLEIKRSQSTEVLVAAVKCQNHAVVKLALANGADPNVRPAGGQESLITTADEESAKLLVAAGANPNVCWGGPAAGTCGAYSVPLIFKFPKDPELLRLMIAKGANPNAEDAQGNTVLGYALERGMVVCAVSLEPGRPEQCLDESPLRTAAAIILLNAGADPNKRSQGHLPLMLVDDSQHEAITLLLDKGARMDDTTLQGVRLGPVSMALATKRPFLAGELLRRLHGKIGSSEKWALFAAARDGNIALVEGLAQHGADLDAQAPYGETALHYAAAKGDVAMVKRLLELGENPNLQTETSDYFISDNKYNLPAILANGVISTFVRRKNMQYLAAGLKPLELPAGETALDIARGNSQMEQLFAGHK